MAEYPSLGVGITGVGWCASLRTFFDAMRTRRAVVEDSAFGYRAAAPALLTNESYFDGKPVGWDPSRMQRREVKS